MKILATSSLEPRVTAPTPVTHDPPPVPFGATTGIAPPVPILNLAVNNTLFILLLRETHHIKIKSHITCETFNVIYLIQCHLCNLQYIGETKRRLKDFNEHRRPIYTQPYW